MVSDQLIQHYEDTMENKPAPHTMHNLPLDCAIMLLEGLSKSHPEGKVNIKQANNIWNYVINELKSRGFDPYTFKIDGFKEIVKKAQEVDNKEKAAEIALYLSKN